MRSRRPCATAEDGRRYIPSSASPSTLASDVSVYGARNLVELFLRLGPCLQGQIFDHVPITQRGSSPEAAQWRLRSGPCGIVIKNCCHLLFDRRKRNEKICDWPDHSAAVFGHLVNRDVRSYQDADRRDHG